MLIVDDHRMFADLLGDSLTADGYVVVDICGTIDEAVAAVTAHQPDAIVLDHVLPPGTGASNVATFRRLAPDTRILMLTGSAERAVLVEAMDAGSHGFITKRRPIAEVLDALRAVLADETTVSPDMVGALFGRPTRDAGPPGGDLSARETEVLQLLGAGSSNQQIATALGISPNTVRNHVQRIFEKLDAHSRLEAVAIAARLGLLPSDRGTSDRGPAER